MPTRRLPAVAPDRRALVVPIAAGTVAVAAATGLGAQTGILDTSGARWIHHALYAVAVAACATAAIVDATGPRRRGAMIPSLLVLVALGRTRGGTSHHGAVAAVATACAGIDAVRVR